MKKILFVIALFFLISGVNAQQYTSHYSIGQASFTESNIALNIVVPNVPLIHLDILPRGKLWPSLIVDESGFIYAGNKIIDSKSGDIVSVDDHTNDVVLHFPNFVSLSPQKEEFILKRNENTCHFSLKHALRFNGRKSPIELIKDHNFSIATSDKLVLALQTHFDKNDEISYDVKGLDLSQCKVIFNKNLGNPDLLVEIAWSKRGGWWITGSIEQTLLRSKDGRTWTKVHLPKELSSLVSSYVINENEIWLAAILASSLDSDPYQLVYSNDAGRTWVSMKKDDVLLKKLPPNWLEGKSRTGQIDQVSK